MSTKRFMLPIASFWLPSLGWACHCGFRIVTHLPVCVLCEILCAGFIPASSMSWVVPHDLASLKSYSLIVLSYEVVATWPPLLQLACETDRRESCSPTRRGSRFSPLPVILRVSQILTVRSRLAVASRWGFLGSSEKPPIFWSWSAHVSASAGFVRTSYRPTRPSSVEK